jgi:Ca2+:H+ antiporter
LKFDYKYALLLAIPVALLARFLGWGDMLQFIASAIAIVPLAGFIGEATEELAVHTGPRIGGLLNATLGNAAELIITIVAIKEGVIDLVIASITGSILGNLLLVLGLSIFLGGLRNGRQTFNRAQATNYATMTILAVVAIMVPAIFGATIDLRSHEDLQPLSLAVAGIMILIYGLGIYYTFTTSEPESNPLSRPAAPVHHGAWSIRKSAAVLTLATIGIVFMSELLVEAVEEVVHQLGWSEFFVGIIIVPLVGNVAEHLVAVQMAIKNHMNLSVEIAMGSSLQVALFVAPVLIFVAALMGREMAFTFNQFELVALAAASLVAVYAFRDAESNWLEGAQLLALYIIIGIAFFFLPELTA